MRRNSQPMSFLEVIPAIDPKRKVETLVQPQFWSYSQDRDGGCAHSGVMGRKNESHQKMDILFHGILASRRGTAGNSLFVPASDT